MAYGYGYPSRNRGYRRRNRRGRRYIGKSAKSGTNWMGLASKAYKTAKFVAGIVNAEKKYVDTPYNNIQVDNSAYVLNCLNLIGEGDDEINRNGRSIKAAFMNIRFIAYLQASAASGVIRMALIRDNANTGSNPAMSDIFQTYTGDLATIDYRNILSGSATRYDILWDKMFTLDSNKNQRQVIQKYIKLDKHIHFIGTGATVASCGNGSYFLAMISTGVTASTTNIAVTGNVRLRYFDN